MGACANTLGGTDAARGAADCSRPLTQTAGTTRPRDWAPPILPARCIKGRGTAPATDARGLRKMARLIQRNGAWVVTDVPVAPPPHREPPPCFMWTGQRVTCGRCGHNTDPAEMVC